MEGVLGLEYISHYSTYHTSLHLKLSYELPEVREYVLLIFEFSPTRTTTSSLYTTPMLKILAYPVDPPQNLCLMSE